MKDHLGSVRVAFTPTGSEKIVVQENTYYPSGAPIADMSWNASPNTNRYKHTGMETIEDFSLGFIDNSARWRLNNTAPMFMGIDPMAEKYYHISPYAYCSNNPIRFIDPTGMTWKTTQDEDIAKRIQKDLTAEVNRLDRKATSLQKDIDKINNNTKLTDEKRAEQVAKKESKLNEVTVTKDFIADMSTRIGDLGTSATVYSFNNLGETAASGFLSSPQAGEIVINYTGGQNSFANQVHETVHATQYEQGLFTRSANNPTMFSFRSLNDRDLAEVSAYMSQYVIAPNTMPYSVNGSVRSIQNINVKWLRGILGVNGKPMYP